MAFDQTTRNRLQRFVGDARALLADEFTRQLQATYGMNPATGDVADIKTLSGLTPHQQETAQLLRDTFTHYLASNESGKEKERKLAALDRIVREQAFTVLNRIAALRMSEARGSLTESLANGYESKGFQLFHRIAGTSLGETGDAYRHYLFSIFDEFTLDLSVLFDRFSAQGRLFPSSPVLLELLALVNDEEVAPLWNEDETIGWIYQYFNSVAERKKMRDASQAPRNSRELAVRNQFFTPRYVVEFLTDNTLGRIWYEMTQGQTGLVDSCEYLVRRPNEVFLSKGETAPEQIEQEGLSQEELLQQTVYIEHRALKDPRDIKMLDPACGSMHFGLYCFDLFEKIYAEAWELESSQGTDAFVREGNKVALTEAFRDKAEFLTHVPRLIIENNIHGVDIDPRAAQVAGLSLWQRAHNSWQQAGIKPQSRPKILKSNIVCAEPMPGEKELLQEFTSQLKPTVLGQLVEVIFEKMELAGEAGTLLKIEKEIADAIAGAKAVWQQQNQALSQFPDLDKVAKSRGEIEFDVSDIDDEGFWKQAEQMILDALIEYSSSASVQRQLFAADAAKGLAFIELTKKRFDVVLMNPPFGEASSTTSKYYTKEYKDSKSDLLMMFVERAKALIDKRGKVGAITSRMPLFNASAARWRKNVLLKHFSLDSLADLGDKVLEATVDTAAFVLSEKKRQQNLGRCFRLISSKEKDIDLRGALLNTGHSSNFLLNHSEIDGIPGSPLAYWVGNSIVSLFKEGNVLASSNREVQQGLSTKDDFRYFRNWFEVELGAENWMPTVKTESYGHYMADVSQVLNYGDDLRELEANIIQKYPYLNGDANWVLHRESNYFQKGLVFSARQRRFSPKPVPLGCSFTHTGLMVFAEEKDLNWLPVYLNSAVVRSILGLLAPPRKMEIGYVSNIPMPKLRDDSILELLENEQINRMNKSMRFAMSDETSKYFSGLCFNVEETTRNNTIDIDSLVAKLLKLSDSDKDLLIEQLPTVTGLSADNQVDYNDLGVNDKFSNFERLVSYLVGVAFGRWILTSEQVTSAEKLVECYLDRVPQHPPIMNKDNHSSVSKGFFDLDELAVKLEKYIEDTEIKRFSDVFYANKKTAVEYLSSANGFFDMHFKMYSKTKRSSPIYWLLQGSSGASPIYVYFHNLTTQTLVACVNDILEPKIHNIKNDILNLREKRSRNSMEEKKYDRLNQLALELEDFQGELLRISKFWQPNLNDGAQITAAPLWRLFQHKAWQKKLKQTWENLEDGDYDWAHLAYTIWPERVLKKCHIDRSIAIAHGVEADLWHEVEVLKGKKKEPVWEWQPKPLSPAELNDYVREKIATDERLALYRSNAKNSGVKS